MPAEDVHLWTTTPARGGDVMTSAEECELLEDLATIVRYHVQELERVEAALQRRLTERDDRGERPRLRLLIPEGGRDA